MNKWFLAFNNGKVFLLAIKNLSVFPMRIISWKFSKWFNRWLCFMQTPKLILKMQQNWLYMLIVVRTWRCLLKNCPFIKRSLEKSNLCETIFANNISSSMYIFPESMHLFKSNSNSHPWEWMNLRSILFVTALNIIQLKRFTSIG